MGFPNFQTGTLTKHSGRTPWPTGPGNNEDTGGSISCHGTQGKERLLRKPELSPPPALGGHSAHLLHGFQVVWPHPTAPRPEGSCAHTYWGLKLQAFFLKVRVYLMRKNH